ncbi:hypothetical protein GCM10023147_04090 [Tsukamurella soli]|uniref:SGNH hydrolase-type esterase domain-containing protein n=1 Tax=Tsukamurella soli TaxID=644556 RepID=A0ABP8J3N7_9ACTN
MLCGAGVATPKPPAAHLAQEVAVVGASIADGMGAPPGGGWAELLADDLGVRADVSADPGAGFVARGVAKEGPMWRLLPALQLDRVHPDVVLVQAGHNDVGEPLLPVIVSVTRLFEAIHTLTPDSVIGLISVFPTGDEPSAAARTTDAAIVAAARTAVPDVFVFDPITGRWHFPRLRDGLHPTEAGHEWIAQRLTGPLRDALDPHQRNSPRRGPTWPDLLTLIFGNSMPDSRQNQGFLGVVTANA